MGEPPARSLFCAARAGALGAAPLKLHHARRGGRRQSRLAALLTPTATVPLLRVELAIRVAAVGRGDNPGVVRRGLRECGLGEHGRRRRDRGERQETLPGSYGSSVALPKPRAGAATRYLGN